MMNIEEIKSNYSKFTLDSLIERGLNYTKSATYANPNSWTISTYLEWAYAFADNTSNKTIANETDFNKICNAIFQLMDGHPLANFKKHNTKKIFHILAYQQFPFKNNLTLKDFSRQDYLFSFSEFNQAFKKQTNFSIHTFLKLLFKIWVWIDEKGFESLLPPKEQEHLFKELFSFIDLLSLKHSGGNQEIITHKKQLSFKTEEYYSFRPDFLVKYPFIEFNEKYFFIHKDIFVRTIHEYLFEYLLDLENENTRRYFDNRFEDYFAIGLSALSIQHKREKDLKNTFPNAEICDYIIDDYLFAECKAIQLKPLAQVNPTVSILKNNLELISKAYQQIISTANILSLNRESFGIIFTYQPFYFSDGTDIWDEFLKNHIETYIKEKNYKLIIPPQNLFFIDIRSWDKLVDALGNGKGNLKEILKTAVLNNKNTETRKFTFDMHLISDNNSKG
ncbi:MAG: hypothetical protein K0B10_12500 [Vicingaceae bacterium]|nr:hypothetical protein [Vicingaceae bacterium]